jgi:putative peptidoglycan lipid II flippase
MFNVAIIVIAVPLVPLAPSLGVERITIVALATLVGGVGQLAIQWPALRREGFRYKPVLDLRDEGLHRVLLLMGPGTIGLAATQINVFVNTMLATSQGTGAVSWLDFAFRLMYLPIGLFGVSIATAATPAISRMVAEQDFSGIRSTLANALGLTLFLNIPATIGLVFLAEPIVAVVLEHGEFTAADTVATAQALQLYAGGLIGYSIVRIISPTFYALQRSRVPVTVSAASVAVNVALNLALVQAMGFRGLALGTTITSLLNATVQLILLRRELGGLEGRRLAVSLARILAAAAVMAVVTWGMHVLLLGALPGATLVRQAARLFATIFVSLAALAAVAQVLRIPEYAGARDLVLNRLRRMGK